MPFQDVNANHMTPAHVTAADAGILALETLFATYLRNLSAEENAKYGEIQEKNKLFVNKAMDFHNSRPALDSPDVDWTEFAKDHATRKRYEMYAQRLASLAKSLTETRRLHDYDNYQNALLDYEYAKYKDRTQPGVGFDAKVEEYGQFFTGGGGNTTEG